MLSIADYRRNTIADIKEIKDALNFYRTSVIEVRVML
jgi:hypothetical protein